MNIVIHPNGYIPLALLYVHPQGYVNNMDRERRGGFNRGPREMHDAVCSDCGKQTQVPFQPDGNRPVYCQECYQKHRPPRRSF
jgi:CxxC-x17-CxxC domain-containing protein